MIVIPYDQLSTDALTGVLEEYASREGTEYGVQDVPLASKVAQLKAQLVNNSACVVFDEDSGTCNLMLSADIDNISI